MSTTISALRGAGLAILAADGGGPARLDDPALARLTREARYETLTGLAAANLRTGRPVVLVAPFSTERADPSARPPEPCHRWQSRAQ